jgi:steroid delta-isomerase-like uncharacterized protein
MAGPGDAPEFVLRLRHTANVGPSGTLRAIGTGHEQPFEGWIDLIGLITEHWRMAMDHAATMRSIYELINASNIAGFGDLLADDFVEHDKVTGLPPTKDGTLRFFRSLLVSFPDWRMDVEDLIAGDDKVVARVKATATHQGEFMGVPSTGARVEVQLIDIMKFDSTGHVCGHWGVADMLSLMQQLGVVPAAAPA